MNMVQNTGGRSRSRSRSWNLSGAGAGVGNFKNGWHRQHAFRLIWYHTVPPVPAILRSFPSVVSSLFQCTSEGIHPNGKNTMLVMLLDHLKLAETSILILLQCVNHKRRAVK